MRPGTGTNSHDLNASCQRSSLSYPALWAAQQGTASFTFAACAGATTSSVRSSQLGGLNAGTDLYRTGFCLFEISDARRTRINAVADTLALVTAQRVAAAGGTSWTRAAPTQDTRSAAARPGSTGPRLPVGDSYHPNRSGYSRAYLPLLRGTAT